MSFIKLTMIGNLGADAKVTAVSGGHFIGFNVAHTEKWKDKSGADQSKTIWAECSYFRTTEQGTKIAEYLKKGLQVYVEGQPSARPWVTADSKAAASLDVKVSFVQLCGAAPAAGNNAAPAATVSGVANGKPAANPPAPAANAADAKKDDSIPF